MNTPQKLLALLIPALLFWLAFPLRSMGFGFLLDAFYYFDQAMWDLGDLVIAVFVPLLTLGLAARGFLRDQAQRAPWTVVMIVALLVVCANVAGYAATD